MPEPRLTRRASLLLPFLLAACGGGEDSFPPLRYNYLPPIRLNVAEFSIEQRFYPSGLPPDITAKAPIHPVDAMRTMAEDRLQAVGTTGQAVFAINNAALTRTDDVITCALAVELDIYPTPGIRSGFARAIASRQHIGRIDDLPATLYDLIKTAMNALNVEFEYQVQRSLVPWLATTTAGQPPVQQQPLETAPEDQSPETPPPGNPPSSFGGPPANAPPSPGGPGAPSGAPTGAPSGPQMLSPPPAQAPAAPLPGTPLPGTPLSGTPVPSTLAPSAPPVSAPPPVAPPPAAAPAVPPSLPSLPPGFH